MNISAKSGLPPFDTGQNVSTHLPESRDRYDPRNDNRPDALSFLVVEPQALFRRGICLLLQQWYPQASFIDAADVAASLRSTDLHPAPALVVVDAGLATASRYEGLRQLTQHYPSSPILLLAAEVDPCAVGAALQNGARGYLPKAASEHHLRCALALVLSGEVYAPANCLLDQSRAAAASCPSTSEAGFEPLRMLTAREADVLVQISAGHSNKEVGRRLGLVECTVKMHVKSILKKLSVANRMQAALLALEPGRLDLIRGLSSGPNCKPAAVATAFQRK
jgi:two-component system, NarL family, nitrate/nitrite response regulator NarL